MRCVARKKQLVGIGAIISLVTGTAWALALGLVAVTGTAARAETPTALDGPFHTAGLTESGIPMEGMTPLDGTAVVPLEMASDGLIQESSAATDVAVQTGQVIGSGDGRIHIIPMLSAKSIKNGDRATIQAIVKAVDGVAKIEARIEREPGQDMGVCSWLSEHPVENLLGLPVATLELKGAPMNLGGTNASGTMGVWQAEWTGDGLEEGYYRVAITVTDRIGHSYTDRSLTFTDPIAGNNVVGSTSYPNAAMTRLDAATLNTAENQLYCAVIDASSGYAYFGTQTTPGIVVKVALGVGSNPPTRLGAVTLNTGENGLHSAVIDASSGYAYFGTITSPGIVVKVSLGVGSNPPTRVGAVTLNTGEDYLHSAVIDASSGYAYFGTYTSPGIVIKVALGAGSNPPTRVGAVTLNTGENNLWNNAVIDASSGHAYFGTSGVPGRVVKVALGAGSNPPTRVGAVTLNTGENTLMSAVIDASSGYAYFGTNTSPGRVVKVALGAGSNPPTRVGAVTLNTGENQPNSAVIDASSGYAYFGTNTTPGIVVKVALGAGSNPPTRVGAVMLNTGENSLMGLVIDASSGYAYFGTYTSPGIVVRVGLSEKGFLKATKLTMTETGSVSSVSFYSHAAAGNVRLALYDNSSNPVLLWDSGSTANTAANAWLTVPISSGTPSSLSLTTGTYWLAWQVDTGIPVPSYTAGVSGDGLFTPMAYGSCPASLQAGTSTTPTLTSERWSEYLTYSTTPTPPSNPGSTAIGLNTITWTWQDNSSDETGFKVYDDPGAGPPVTLQTTTAADAQSWPHGGLNTNTQYAFQVSATNAFGDSTKTSNYMAWTLIEAVVGLGFSGVTTTGISVVSTNTPSNLTSGTSGLYFANTTMGTNSGWQQNNTPWGSSGLLPNTSYAFTGQSRNGESTTTAPAAGSKYTLIEAVAGLAFSGVGTTTISVTSTNTPGNLTSGTSGLYFANATTGTNSGWQQNNSTWGSGSLTPNTQYAFSGQSRNGESVTTTAATSSKYTLVGPPSIGNNITCDKSVNTPYMGGTAFTLTNPAGFGAGTHGGSIYNVTTFKYVWDQFSTHTFTGSETDWNSGSIVKTPTNSGSRYLHLQSFNGEGVANTTTLDFGPFVTDADPPTPVITGATTLTNTARTLTIAFGEHVNGFSLPGGASVTNGTASNLQATGNPGEYTVDILGSGTNTVSVSVPAGVATDDAANPNNPTASAFTYPFDNVAPTPVITGSTTLTNTTRTLTIAFGENVNGFSLPSGVSVTNGTASNLQATANPGEFTVDILGFGTTTVSVSVPASAATDDAGNPSNPSAGAFTFPFDNVPPTADITLSDPLATDLDVLHFSLRFSEPLAVPLAPANISLTPGSLPGAIGVSGTDPNYTVTVTLSNPDADGTLSITILSGAVTDPAGNLFEYAESSSYTIENVSMPVAALTGMAGLIGLIVASGVRRLGRK